MGFSGKPSKACELCRCRRTRPSCSQCQRKNITCVYRDLDSLAFRHENDAVIRRVQRGHQSTSNALAVKSSYDNSAYVFEPVSLRVPQEDVASAFFVSRFAYGIYQDYVPSLYKHNDCSAALKSSVEAVGLAALSLSRSESSLLDEARRCHLAAVKKVQLSLQSPTTTNRADTLASVMLLALFAGMTCEPAAAHINWTKHVKGALAILNNTASRVDDDPVVNILSSHVTSCVLVDCLQSVVAPPKQFTEIKFEPRMPVSFQDKSEYVLELLAEVRPRRVTTENIADMIRKLDIVDSQLNDLLKVLVKAHPKTVFPNNVGAHQPVYYVYASLKSARIWNIIRLTKLSAAELRYDKMSELRKLDPKTTNLTGIDINHHEEYASSSAELLIHDICASVPETLRSPRNSSSRTHIEELDAINWAHSLLWPVSAARASIHAPEYLRGYMQRTLQNMWDVTKFPIVDYHKKMIDEEIAPHIWTHVFFFMC